MWWGACGIAALFSVRMWVGRVKSEGRKKKLEVSLQRRGEYVEDRCRSSPAGQVRTGGSLDAGDEESLGNQVTLACAFLLYRNYLPRCRHGRVTQGWGSEGTCDKITGQWNQGFSKRMIVHDGAWKLGWRRTEIMAGWGNWGTLTQHSHFHKCMWKRTLCLCVQQLRLRAFTAVGLGSNPTWGIEIP